MNTYRSAYEEYYKNINNGIKRKNQNTTIKRNINIKNNTLIDIFIKRITKELIGSIILIMFFIGLKYIPLTQFKYVHNEFKYILNKGYNYDDYINAFSNIQIGNEQVKDLKISNYTIDDLRIENLKVNTFKFIKYLKSNSFEN